MSKLLFNYPNVKIYRSILPPGKGILKDFLTLAYRCNYRDGIVKYCGYENFVKAGQWSGGIAGLKRMLKKRTRNDTALALKELETLDFISIESGDGGKVTITINGLFPNELSAIELQFYREHIDILSTSNKAKVAVDEAMKTEYTKIQNTSKKCYVNDDSGFIFLARNLTERLVEAKYKFDDIDAFLDIWLHTVYHEPHNPFSDECPVIMFSKSKTILTLDCLGKRWGWERTKVSRFFKKYSYYFSLIKLQSSYGSVIFNKSYLEINDFTVPTQNDCFEIVNQFKKYGDCFFNSEEKNCSENEYINLCINTFANTFIN